MVRAAILNLVCWPNHSGRMELGPIRVGRPSFASRWVLLTHLAGGCRVYTEVKMGGVWALYKNNISNFPNYFFYFQQEFFYKKKTCAALSAVQIAFWSNTCYDRSIICSQGHLSLIQTLVQKSFFDCQKLPPFMYQAKVRLSLVPSNRFHLDGVLIS